MNTLKTALEELNKRFSLFLRYEETTNRLLLAPLEELEELVSARKAIIADIDKINASLQALSSKEGGEQLAAALKTGCERGGLTPQLQEIYDKAQLTFAVINRVQKTEPQIMERLREEQLSMTEDFKESNKKPKVDNYLKALNKSKESGLLLDIKK